MREILASILLFLGVTSATKSTSPVNSGQVDQSDKITLARTIWGEARGEGYSGMQSVANVIMNRYAAAQASVAKAQQFGGTDRAC